MTMYHVVDHAPVACDSGILCKVGAHYMSEASARDAINTVAPVVATVAVVAPTVQHASSSSSYGGGFFAGVGEFAGDALDAAGGIIGVIADIINIFD